MTFYNIPWMLKGKARYSATLDIDVLGFKIMYRNTKRMHRQHKYLWCLHPQSTMYYAESTMHMISGFGQNNFTIFPLEKKGLTTLTPARY